MGPFKAWLSQFSLSFFWIHWLHHRSIICARWEPHLPNWLLKYLLVVLGRFSDTLWFWLELLLHKVAWADTILLDHWLEIGILHVTWCYESRWVCDMGSFCMSTCSGRATDYDFQRVILICWTLIQAISQARCHIQCILSLHRLIHVVSGLAHIDGLCSWYVVKVADQRQFTRLLIRVSFLGILPVYILFYYWTSVNAKLHVLASIHRRFYSLCDIRGRSSPFKLVLQLDLLLQSALILFLGVKGYPVDGVYTLHVRSVDESLSLLTQLRFSQFIDL